eukprot:scaffold84578_cov15-Tisochrysis_lutea.AAC.1
MSSAALRCVACVIKQWPGKTSHPRTVSNICRTGQAGQVCKIKQMLERWLHDGVLEDAYGEFMVQANKVGLTALQDEHGRL